MLSNMDILTYGLLGVFALASLISNVYWLRLVTVIGCIIALIYYLVAIDPLQWYLIVFGVLFIFTNIYELWHVHRAKFQLHFSENELALHQQVFSDLNPEQYMALMAIAVWRDVEPGEILIEQGKTVTSLSLIFKGMVKVDVGRNHYIQIRDGQFIGEMSYVSGNPGTGTVIAEEKSLLVQWPQQALKTLVSESNVIGNCIQALFNADLMKKLKD